MLTVLGSLLGFLGSFLPEIFKYVRDRSDQSHELAILDRQMEMMKLRHRHSLEHLQMIEDTTTQTLLYKYAPRSGVKWVDALSGSVRPFLTYAFFMLYGALKIVEIYGLWTSLPFLGWETLLGRIWHEEDQILFATVISFWFGQRALRRPGKEKR